MSDRGRRAILVVEDDAALREMVIDVLRDDGYDAVAATDGRAAITALRDHRPPPDALCLVILDMMLPEADGVEVLRALAQFGGYVPVVAMSADPRQLRRAAEAGADATMVKPFEVDGLLAVVERNCAH